MEQLEITLFQKAQYVVSTKLIVNELELFWVVKLLFFSVIWLSQHQMCGGNVKPTTYLNKLILVVLVIT